MKIYSYSSMLHDNGTVYLEKRNEYKVDGRRKFSTAEDVKDFIFNGIGLHKCAEEMVYILCLDSALHMIGYFEVSHGTVNISYATPREIFQKALLIGAVNIIMTHNHPSGDLSPSKEDIQVTKQISDAGNIIGIRLLEHIIVERSGCYFSFYEHKLIEN